MSGRLGIDSWATKADSSEAPVGAGSSKGKTAPMIPGLALREAAGEPARATHSAHPASHQRGFISLSGRAVNPENLPGSPLKQ